jgi:hypothetical protein
MSISVGKYGKLEVFLKDGDRRPVPIDLNISNVSITKTIFINNNKQMSFVVRFPDYSGDPPERLYIYIGTDPIRRWKDDYSICLKREYDFANHPIWVADPEDTSRISKQFWCAAEAEMTICDCDKTPLLTITGDKAATIIGLSYDEWYKNVYEGVKKGLESVNQESDITSPFRQEINVGNSSYANPSKSEILALYWQIKSCLDDLGKCAAQITSNPAQRNYANHHFFEMPGTQSSNASANAFSHGFVAVQSYQTIGGNIVPEKYISTQVKTTHNIEENYIVLQCLKRVLSYLQAISTEIGEYIDDLKKIEVKLPLGIHKEQLREEVRQHKNEKDDILEQIERFEYHVKRFSFLDRSYRPSCLSFSSELLYYDKRYSTVWKILARIDRILSYINVSDEVVQFQVAPFQEVYEKWCLLKIVSSLEELGFRKISSASKSPLYGNPRFNSLYCEFENSQDPELRVEVWFEKKYPFTNTQSTAPLYGFWEPAYVGTPKNEWKHTPDISLEFFRGSDYPLIVTFDPTLGGRSYWSDKYKYKKTLRARDSDGSDIRIVKAAWAIAPGQLWNSNPPYYVDDDGNFTEGTILLNHSEESQQALHTTLKRILECNKLCDLSV